MKKYGRFLVQEHKAKTDINHVWLKLLSHVCDALAITFLFLCDQSSSNDNQSPPVSRPNPGIWPIFYWWKVKRGLQLFYPRSSNNTYWNIYLLISLNLSNPRLQWTGLCKDINTKHLYYILNSPIDPEEERGTSSITIIVPFKHNNSCHTYRRIHLKSNIIKSLVHIH